MERNWADEGANNTGQTAGADNEERTMRGGQWGWMMGGGLQGADEGGWTMGGRLRRVG